MLQNLLVLPFCDALMSEESKVFTDCQLTCRSTLTFMKQTTKGENVKWAVQACLQPNLDNQVGQRWACVRVCVM